MCKVLHMIHGDLIESYTIIDLPTFSQLTNKYLSHVLGEDKFKIVSAEGLDEENIPTHDLFISTWALSESPEECQDYLEENDWYGCDRFLMSFHQCGDHIPFMYESTILKTHCEEMGLILEDVKVIPGVNYYAFQ